MKISTRYSHLAIIGLAISSIVPAFAKETSQQIAGRKELNSLYQRIDKNVSKYDFSLLFKSTAPDFKYFRVDGTVSNRAEWLAGQKQATTLSNLTLATKIQNIQWSGADAIVLVKAISKAKRHSTFIEDRSTTKDYWRKTKSGWLIYKTVCTEQHYFENGRQIN